MNIISARSPYQIIINESGQTGSKVELFVWNKGTTEPTIPTYIMSENIASVTQTETNYNISPYILEYIKQSVSYYNTVPTIESNNNWCFARVKTYKNVSGTFTLLSNILYIGINAYTEVADGLNYNIGDGIDAVLLGTTNNSNNKILYNTLIPSFNFICLSSSTNNYYIKYYSANGTLLNSNTFRTAITPNYYNYKLPLGYSGSSYCIISTDEEGLLYKIYAEQLEECKYTPVNCSYVNKLGGWQQLTLFKAQTNKIDVKGSKYNLMQTDVNYNIYLGQTKSLNINGTQNITCNTGWVYEGYNEFIKELMLSDTILIDNKPATIKTQSLQYKTNILDKNINFTLEFEYSNSLINNIV
ncbi:hypothetical protein UFOVP531_15 [uncultured Caudovirales phage]|uniref:Uncharacterized protein n=1 Tax=uncultured Caudovirales phage TaxID=2100421 RepID=A0A6J5MNC6_9CAUD|nr:hypothetical protein UFOVP531_15 [uncultured Caudovirales phage]